MIDLIFYYLLSIPIWYFVAKFAIKKITGGTWTRADRKVVLALVPTWPALLIIIFMLAFTKNSPTDNDEVSW